MAHFKTNQAIYLECQGTFKRTQETKLWKGTSQEKGSKKALCIPRSTVKSIIKKPNVCGTTKNLLGSGSPSKLDEATKRAMKTRCYRTLWQTVVIVRM